MKTLLVQDELRAGVSLKSLETKYHLHVKRGFKYPNLVLLKYDQIESPMGDPLVKQCRGLILDEANNWQVVSRPFDKFFNYGEGHAAKIDWSTATVQEKLDGSLIQLYWYDGAWRVATSGSPEASGPVNELGYTFSELLFKVWDELGYNLPPDSLKSHTFLFELMTPYNRVVVRHKSNDLKLIGVRSLDGVETHPLAFVKVNNLNWSVVREFPIATIDEVTDTFSSMDPLHQEGYVIVDGEFNRIKVKHPGYVAIHHMKDGFGPKRVLEIIRTGESPELLVHFPEWTDIFNQVRGKYDELVNHLETSYAEAIEKTNAAVPPGVLVSASWLQKEFASHAVKTRNSSTLFQLRKGQVKSVQQSLAEMNIRSLMDILKIKDIEVSNE